jgi:NitT/TauT family transport system substrate-binding protein
MRLGYLLNLTHGPAIIALDRELKDGVAGLPVEPQPFQTGPEEVSALLSGSLDAAYVGPGPYVMAASRAPGRLRLLGGVVTGGQRLVATPESGIRSVADLAGKRVAVPAHGNTQDLTLRLLLQQAGLRGDDQGGDVGVVPVKNASLGDAIDSGAIDAALAPEPYAAKLEAKGTVVPVAAANAQIERWKIPATVLVVTEAFARAEPAATRALVAANAKAVARAQAHPLLVARAFNALIAEQTGKTVDEPVLLAALAQMQATTAIAPGAMQLMVDAADRAGYLGGPVPADVLIPRAG